MDYTELSELVYGQAYSSDVARRMLYGSRRTLELMDAERLSEIDETDVLAEIDNKTTELKKERQKFFDQRREFNKILTADARREHLFDFLLDSAQKLNDTIGCIYRDAPGVLPDEQSIDLRNEAILVFSDWHYGLKTENAYNKFDTSICKVRVRRIVENAIERIKLHACKRLHIVVLGDLFHGAIHTSARVASEEYVCDQLMQSSEILAQSIEYLSQYVEQTMVYCTYGNHARTVQNKNDSIHRDNMERIVPWWLEQRLASYDNIIISPDSGTEFILFESCGHTICAVHGDNNKVKTAPRMLSTLFQKTYGADIEYILLGDKHHRESFNELGITAMICGSLCGADDYANNKRLYSEPSQLLLIANKEFGVDAEYQLRC